MCLGASNVSFGLPERHALNAAFLPMAMAAGLTSAIMCTAEVCVQSVRAADLLLGHDEWGASWIAAHRAAGRREGGQEAAAWSSDRPAAFERLEPADAEAELRSPEARPSGSPALRARRRPTFACPSGTPVFDAASWNGIAIDSTCGGHGTCKKCKVRIVDGELPVGPVDPRAFT